MDNLKLYEEFKNSIIYKGEINEKRELPRAEQVLYDALSDEQRSMVDYILSKDENWERWFLKDKSLDLTTTSDRRRFRFDFKKNKVTFDPNGDYGSSVYIDFRPNKGVKSIRLDKGIEKFRIFVDDNIDNIG